MRLNPSSSKQWISQIQFAVTSRAKHYKRSKFRRFKLQLNSTAASQCWFRRSSIAISSQKNIISRHHILAKTQPNAKTAEQSQVMSATDSWQVKTRSSKMPSHKDQAFYHSLILRVSLERIERKYVRNDKIISANIEKIFRNFLFFAKYKFFLERDLNPSDGRKKWSNAFQSQSFKPR